jgi:hypothetical protein
MAPREVTMQTARRPDLDWLRVGAFGLLILYHVGMVFVTWDWHVKTAHPSDALEPAMVLLNPWRLSLLFFVSGAATRFMAAKMAPGRLAALRWQRLGIPLLFGMLVVVPPQSFVQVSEHGYHLGYWAFYERYLTAYRGFCDAHGCLIVPTWNHLWFVAYLLVYTSLLLAFQVVGLRVPGRVAQLAGRAMAGVGALILPALWLILLRQTLAPRFPETHALWGDWDAHAVCFSMFLLGFWLAQAGGFWAALVRWRYVAVAAALAAYGLFEYFDRVVYPGDAIAPPAVWRVLRCAYGVQQWGSIAAVLGFGHLYLRRGGAVLNYLTQGVFPFYIVHQTIIVVVEYWLKPLGLPALDEGLILILVTAAGCLATYEIVRRVACLRPLFGLRAAEGRKQGQGSALDPLGTSPQTP